MGRRLILVLGWGCLGRGSCKRGGSIRCLGVPVLVIAVARGVDYDICLA